MYERTYKLEQHEFLIGKQNNVTHLITQPLVPSPQPEPKVKCVGYKNSEIQAVISVKKVQQCRRPTMAKKLQC